MAKLTMVFGVVLVLLGVGVFLSAGAHAPTSLIPAYFGLLLIVFGALANTDDVKKRKLWMHLAVLIGLVGFIFPFARSIRGAITLLQGGTVLRPLAVEESMAMALICLVYTALCVRWFISNRRNRVAA